MRRFTTPAIACSRSCTSSRSEARRQGGGLQRFHFELFLELHEFADLQNIIVPLKNPESPAGKYDLTVTVQDRISMVSESKTIPVTY